jgi:uncharacterized protein YfdQ (DUF2303 family)
MSAPQTESEAVAQIVRDSAQPIFKQPAAHGTAVPLIVNPRTCAVESLEKFLPLPVRKRAVVNLRDVDSFIDYVKLHQEPGTVVLGNLDPDGASFAAILDYHLTNGDPAATDFKPGAPGWGAHRCNLKLEHTPEWLAWTERDEEPLGQVEFARFLEDNRLDIADPDAATIIEMATSFEATSGAVFKGAVRMDNGDRKITFDTTTQARAGSPERQIQIPEIITLKLPVFTNGPEFEVKAFFRYRLVNGGVMLFYSLIRPHKVVELAVQTARQAIESELKRTVLHGNVQAIG